MDSFSNGNGARLTLGSAVLVYLIAYNETTAPCVVLATIAATIYAALAGKYFNFFPIPGMSAQP